VAIAEISLPLSTLKNPPEIRVSGDRCVIRLIGAILDGDSIHFGSFSAAVMHKGESHANVCIGFKPEFSETNHIPRSLDEQSRLDALGGNRALFQGHVYKPTAP
jgi:hypothetical protein